LSAYVAKRKKIAVFHMEAGNRCYDENVPEETNRKIIDSLSTYLLPYTQRSRENLLNE
jgi:UDP-N-acetylglucosamine 2-epimerase (non-hydrolysing)